MSTTMLVGRDDPLLERLTPMIQPKLIELGWAQETDENTTLSDYIVMMLHNGPTQESFAAELSGDLLSLDSDDPGAAHFAQWLTAKIDSLRSGVGGAGAVANGSGMEADTEMGDHMQAEVNGSVPTGPKSMRNGSRGPKRNMLGQITKHLERPNESVLHRVREANSGGRINSHSREPPKGPRNGNVARNVQRMANSNGRSSNMVPGTMGSNGSTLGMGPGPLQNGPAMAPLMSPEQQMQMMAMMQQQMQMMSQVMTPQQQAAFMNGQGLPGDAPQHHGRSLFDRVDKSQQRRGRQGQPQTSQSRPQDMIMSNSPAGDHPSSSMEVEASQEPKAADKDEKLCRFNLKCTNASCTFLHQSPAAPPGAPIDVNDTCVFGVACKNRKCVAAHPSPAQRTTHQAEQDCKFFPNCTNPACPFKHPDMPLCRFGANCSKEGCRFTHVQTECRFFPCKNPTCIYKHKEGQRGIFEDKVWVAGQEQEKKHVSERKFMDEGVEEELIIPGAGSNASGSVAAEIIT